MSNRFQERIDSALPADYFLDEPDCPACGDTMKPKWRGYEIMWECVECEKQKEDEQ